jgi:hypothetical protein
MHAQAIVEAVYHKLVFGVGRVVSICTSPPGVE